jgi:type I restriction enzyme M protein
LANPPFNVDAVYKERLTDMVGAGRRFPFGLPRTDNANYLWIQLFYSSLHAKGRAGFVMANSKSDASSSEQALRRQLIEARAVDAMVYMPELYKQKCSAVFEPVYESYPERDRGVYS